jgi:hypothetical protein
MDKLSESWLKEFLCRQASESKKYRKEKMKRIITWFIIVFISSPIFADLKFISRNNLPNDTLHPNLEYYAKYKKRNVLIYNKITDELLLTIENNDFVTCVALSSDNKFVAVGDFTNLTLYKLFTDELNSKLALKNKVVIQEGEKINSVTFHPTRQTFAYYSNYNVIIKNYSKRTIIEVTKINLSNKIDELYFSSDGDEIIATYGKKKMIADISIWNNNMGSFMVLSSPEFKISDFKVIDGNKNKKIEAGELIDVKIDFQNIGLGDANNVTFEFKESIRKDYLLEHKYTIIQQFDEILKGESASALVQVLVSDFAENEIRLIFNITSSAGKPSDLIDYEIPIKIDDYFIIASEKNNDEKVVLEKKNVESINFVDVDNNIPKTNIDGKNTLAIIIGIEDYKYAPTVDFASNDARVFYQYSKSVFGIPERNIYYRINDGATSGEFNKIFADDGWIARRLKKGQTDVIVYYSGHGAPDTKSEKGYLIPHDIDPNYANTGVSLDFIYSSLSKLEAKSVTLFIDACFSGESRSEEMLIAGIRPISVKIKNPILTTENMAVFSASTGEQYSSAYPEKQHGLFTYFLLKGLKGKAKGSDTKITLDELQKYIHENVSNTAGYLDKEQNPTFISKDKTRVLLKH